MTVICPGCKAENHLPDSLDRNTTYKCHACQTKFDCISNTNFGKVAVWMLMAWWLVPGLVWVSRPIIHSAEEYSFQAWIGQLFLWSPSFLLPVIVVATAYFLRKGFRHLRFAGVSPKGFRAFVCASVLGCCGCAAGIALFVNSL